MLFVDLVLAVDAALNEAGLDHAFGGALALMHHVEEPRTTWDVDVNISVPTERAAEVLDALRAIAPSDVSHLQLLVADGQVRLMSGRYPVDVFLAVHEFHEDARTGVVVRPFADTELPYVSATHLCVLKALFNRSKDWTDIEAMVRHGSVDVPRAIGWLVTLVGDDDDRPSRIRALSLLGPDEPVTARALFGRKQGSGQ